MNQLTHESKVSPASTRLAAAATSLHGHLLRTHWTGRTVKGPDPGIRLNVRIGRFIKSYTRWLPWRDKIVYAQAQKYWILSNWLMVESGLGDVESSREISVACTEFLLEAQRPEGYWEYPNREWKGRIATVEGNYASMALLESYRHTQDERYLQAARRWYDYATTKIGFRARGDGLAINYFGNRGSMMVPNNSASALRIFAQLASATGDDHYLEYCAPMVTFLAEVQLDTGELPYGVAWPGNPNGKDRIHFLCYQYNSFQFLNLADYYELTGDERIWPVLKLLAGFVAAGVRQNGASCYDCHHRKPDVMYYGMAAGAAITRAADLGLEVDLKLAERIYDRVLRNQRSDGSMQYYSRSNYGLLSDRRSYPRYLSMILYHLLLREKILRSARLQSV